MPQQEFTAIEDFVFNPGFRDWLINNNSIHKDYWENWLKENPGKVNVLNYAKGIVYALSVNHQQLSEDDIDKEIKAIISKAKNHEGADSEIPVLSNKKGLLRKVNWWLPVAAAAILFLIFSLGYFRTINHTEEDRQVGAYEPISSTGPSSSEQANNSDTVQAITLSDGSRVQLYPKSKLRFSHDSFSKHREVFLTGEAFFDVVKNTSLPFYVYTKSLVTKVLGTSFNVKAYSSENDASVLVKTGKVSVYKKENFSKKNTVANKMDGLIVTPNQQVIYDLKNNQLTKTIVDKPFILASNLKETFEFNSTPLKEVFKTLQNAYGITIMYDEAAINSCSLSASMGSENFYEKLELICKTIEASYESIDGTIFITAHGCN
jgi:transmembrane sensor